MANGRKSKRPVSLSAPSQERSRVRIAKPSRASSIASTETATILLNMANGNISPGASSGVRHDIGSSTIAGSNASSPAMQVEPSSEVEPSTNTLGTLSIKRDDGKWECGACDRTYKSRSSAMRHQKTAHICKNQFVCNVCGEFFLSEKGLGGHKGKKH